MFRRVRPWTYLTTTALMLWHFNIAIAFDGSGGGAITTEVFREAPQVIVGRVVSSHQMKDIAPWWTGYMQAADLRPFEAEFKVERVIKGNADIVGDTVRVRYPASVAEEGRMGSYLPGFADVVGTARCLICLSFQGTEQRTFLLYRPNAYLLLGKESEGDKWKTLSPEARLGCELTSAILDSDIRVSVPAISTAGHAGIGNEAVFDAVRTRLPDKNYQVACAAAGALIQMGDIDILYVIDDYLERWKGASAGIVGAALWHVTDERAVPALVHLFSQRSESHIRLGAVYALRHIKASNAVAALAFALDDPDESIRYYATMGLANQTNRMNPEWAWGLKHFHQDTNGLTEKWKEWWVQEGKDQYPSLETVIKDYEQTKQELRNSLTVVSLPPSPPTSSSGENSVSPAKTSWLQKNRLVLIAGGGCVVLGTAVLLFLRARKNLRQRSGL